jgi:IS4 transposase
MFVIPAQAHYCPGKIWGWAKKALQIKVDRYKTESANSTTEICNVFRISRIAEILKRIPRGNFDTLARQCQADRYSKRFDAWSHLVAMVYGHLSGVQSLRQLEAGYNSQRNHHYHLGTCMLRRSTLADANGRRPVELFSQVAQGLMAQLKSRHSRDARHLLYLLDSTSFTLKGPGFDSWTLASRTRNTQGLKLHVLYSAGAPLSFSFTPANVNDVEEGAKLAIEAGRTYVFDKGYCDYNWWAAIDAAGASFVTRFKRNAAVSVLEEAVIAPQAAETILSDQRVSFKYRHPGGGRRNHYAAALRRIVVARPGHPTDLVLATNDMRTPALEIAQHYRNRWQIELFFKWIKQHLRIKRFLGRSENAVRIQVVTALIAYLLMMLYRQDHGVTSPLSMLLASLRSTLFQRPTLESEMYRRRQHRKRTFDASQAPLFT